MDNFQVTQGAALVIDVTLRDATGAVVTTYDGSEALVTTLWPGGARSASATVATAWTLAAAGTVAITIDAATTAALDPGRYQLLTRIDDAGTTVDGYACTLDIKVAAGTALAPPSYCSFDDLLRYGRSWLRELQTEDDETGFAEQIGRARTWIEDLAHAHYRVAGMTMVVGGQAFGPRRSGARSAWLADQLAANTLMVTDQVREAAAKKALAEICAGQVGPSDQAAGYARLARYYHAEADYLATCLVLQLDTDRDGSADVTIDCSCTDPMSA